MKCIFCKSTQSEVVETRVLDDCMAVRRRRQCQNCKKRYTTYERAEELPIFVTKRNDKRERFEASKLREGIVKAVEKTNVTAENIENIISNVISNITDAGKNETTSAEIGDLVAQELKKIDKVAYIRFASVFRRFVDIEDIKNELEKLT